MILYSTDITPRLQYIVDFFSKELFEEKIIIITDKEKFINTNQPKINYSENEFGEDEFFIHSTHLLFETYIRRQEVECFELNYHKAFFQTDGDFPFDIFAASFYLISRYEEYFPHSKDEYGRYPHTSSIAYQQGFLQMPLINIWLGDFKKALQKKFPEIIFRHSSFQFIPTYDIDIAYSYLHKGKRRNAGALIKSFSHGKFPLAIDRIKVLRGKKTDPFDAYEWLDSLHLYCRVKAIYFFLVAKEQKGYDKNISPDKKALQDLIQYHAAGYTIGVHPSWQSGDDEKLLKEEIEWLSSVNNKKIINSRQHYIRMHLPETYRKLINAGIEKEFSMGYGSINGFRASVASSFYWFDLEKNEQTNLQVFPFCFMDANSFYEQKFTAQQAMDELLHYYRAIKKVNGLMTTIWHNHFLGTDPQFAGWKEVYEIFLKEEVYWDM
jgi:hypothetical protein